MAVMADWGPQKFQISSSQVVILESLTTSLTLKQDSENDTSGTQPTNTRGRDLRPISFKVKYLAAAGANPRTEIEAWEALLGKMYPLNIGGRRFGAQNMKLIEVSTSDILLTNQGEFIQAVVSVKLEESSEGKTSKLLSNTNAAEQAINDKVAALTATASSSDKASKRNAR